MSVLDRETLDASPLADLHTIASELSIDGYRRLRRAELTDAILKRQSGVAPDEPDDDAETATTPESALESASTPESESPPEPEPKSTPEPEPEAEAAPRRRRGRRGGRGRNAERDEETANAAEDDGEKPKPAAAATEERPPRRAAPDDDKVVEGVVDLQPNGSGFLRVSPPEVSPDDVYISAAQVKRCELVAGDRISGPRRPARRAERFPSLVRIDTINGRPADEVADGGRFDDLPAAFPDEPLPLGTEDPTLAAIASLTPLGRGSRATIVGPARSGKTEALRKLAEALSTHDELEVLLVLAGVRPEEISEWARGRVAPAAASSFASSADTQAQTVEGVVEQARRIAARGGNAVVLVDTLEGLHPSAARKALAAARNIIDGGSVTVIATASRSLGGETTVITLDGARASLGQFPAIDPSQSGTIRVERLVGEAGAEAIAKARVDAAGA